MRTVLLILLLACSGCNKVPNLSKPAAEDHKAAILRSEVARQYFLAGAIAASTVHLDYCERQINQGKEPGLGLETPEWVKRSEALWMAKHPEGFTLK